MSQHVIDPVTKQVTDWYVGALEGEEQVRAAGIVARRLRDERVRGGLVPVPARRDTLICGCPWGSPVDPDGSCPRCSA